MLNALLHPFSPLYPHSRPAGKEREIQRQQSLLWQKIIAETSDALTTSERKLEAHANKLSDAKGASVAIEAQVESSATAFKAAQASYDVAAKEHTALKDAMAALERKDVKVSAAATFRIHHQRSCTVGE